jgi:hypothetical protein
MVASGSAALSIGQEPPVDCYFGGISVVATSRMCCIINDIREDKESNQTGNAGTT